MTQQTDYSKIRYVKPSTVAEMVGVSGETVRRWVRSGKLPAIKMNTSWRIKHSDVLAMVQKETNHVDE